MLTELKKYKLQDLIEKIEKVDDMVKLHSSNPSKFMYEQYSAKKEKLLGYLIEELADAKLRSPYSFRIIVLALMRFYPEVIESKAKKASLSKDRHYHELNSLEQVLA